MVCVDLLLFFGVVPFEFFCLRAVRAHPDNVGFGVDVLVANGFIVATMAGAMGASTALAVPRIEALSAPAKTFSGSTLQVPYVASGFGTVDYEVLTKDGVQLAAGLSSSKSGVLRFAVPQSGAGSPYTLHVRLHSAF